MTLKIATNIELPTSIATQANALLAMRGAGKSNALVVLAEEMHDAGIPWVAVDPKGDWWGIRSSNDGKGAGLPVPILGGLHGDVPLQPDAGHLIADLIFDENLTAVLDVSDFSKAERARFLVGFFDRLYQRHRKEPQVRHVFLEEAHEYIPQQVTGDAARLKDSAARIVLMGRSFGLGSTLASQRSARIHKDVLTQTDTLIPMRTTSPQDRKAILAWVEEHDTGLELVATLPALKDGEAFLWSPHALGETSRIRFRRRRTFDSGATPQHGQARKPATLADIDLAAVERSMAEAIEKARADDPAVLRRRIAELERHVRDAEKRPVEPERINVPVPFVPSALVGDLRDFVAHWENTRHEVERLTRIAERFERFLEDEVDNGFIETEFPAGAKQGSRTSGGMATRQTHRPADDTNRPRGQAGTPIAKAGGATQPAGSPPAGAARLQKAERTILSVLATYGRRTVSQTAILSEYSANGGGFRNALSSLRTKGYIDGRGDLEITPAGIEALGEFDRLPEPGPELVVHWQRRLGKAERLILGVLADAYPAALTVEKVSELAGYASNGGGFRNALSRLRTLELIEGRGELRASDTLCGGRT